MNRYADQVLDQYDRPIPGALVYVYNWDGLNNVAGALEALTDDAGASLANPLKTDPFGNFYFKSADGQKLLEIHFGGKLQEREIIGVGTPPKGDPGGTPQAIGLFTTAATHLGGAGFNIPSGIDIVATAGYGSLDKGAALYVADAAVNSAYVTAHPKSSFISTNSRGFRLSTEQDITPPIYSAAYDGVTDDTAAWNALVADVNLGMVSVITLVPGTMAINGVTTAFTKGCTIQGVAGASKILDTGGTGFLLDWEDLPVTERVVLKDFDLVTNRQEGRRAVRASWVATVVNTAVQRFYAENVDIRGDDILTSGFLSGIQLENAYSPVAVNVNMYGRQSANTSAGHGHMEYFWDFRADTSNYTIDVRLDNCTGYAAVTAITGTMHLEGIAFNQCSFVFCQNLGNIVPSDVTLAPYFSAVDCQFEYYDTGWYLENVSWVIWDNTACFRNSLGAGTSGYFLHVKGAQSVVATSNKLTAGDSGGVVTNGFEFENVNRVQSADNEISGCAGKSIWFTGTTQNAFSKNDTIAPASGGTPYLNDSSNASTNSRRGMTIIGTASKVAAHIAAPVSLTTAFATCTSVGVAVQPGDKLRICITAHVNTPSGADHLIQYRLVPNSGTWFTFAYSTTTINWDGRLSTAVNSTWFEAREFTVDVGTASALGVVNFDLATGAGTANLDDCQISVELL